jgi:hypothetical protein
MFMKLGTRASPICHRNARCVLVQETLVQESPVQESLVQENLGLGTMACAAMPACRAVPELQSRVGQGERPDVATIPALARCLGMFF